MPAQRRKEEPEPKPETEAKLPQAPEPKDGWLAVGQAYEGRTRPDGLDKEWC